MKIRTLAAVAKVAAGEVAERVQSYLAPGNRHLPKITTKFQNNFGGDYERGNDVSRSREDAEKMSFFLRASATPRENKFPMRFVLDLTAMLGN